MTVAITQLVPWALTDDDFSPEIGGIPEDAPWTLTLELQLAGAVFTSRRTGRGPLRLDPSSLWGAVRTGEGIRGDALDPVHGRLHVDVVGHTRLEQQFARAFIAPDVIVEDVTRPLPGRLFLPAGTERVPLVLSLSGSEGGFMVRSPALLASRGVACLSVAYFNHPGCADDLADIPLEIFGKVLDNIRRHPRIDGERVFIAGASRGSELALLLATLHHDLAGVVAETPAAHCWPAMTKDGSNHASWTLGGTPLAAVPIDAAHEQRLGCAKGKEYAQTLSSALDSASDTAREAARIPAEDIACPVLLISGREDAVWDSTRYGDEVLAALQGPGHQHLALNDCGHGISIVGLPIETRLVHPVSGRVVDLGGSIAGTAAGTAAAWAAKQAFFSRGSLDHKEPQP